MAKWTAADMPSQAGRVALVTGANNGLGLETATALAAKGAHVILGCRNADRAQVAAGTIRRAVPGAKLEVLPIDLASLASIRSAADAVLQRHARLDRLCNNAGVMMLPFGKTVDGHEQVFAINHLGPFALTGLLLPLLARTPGARIVALGSLTHRTATLDVDDVQFARSAYSRPRAYGASKLANLLFAFELDRRLREQKLDVISVAAHPGWAATAIALGGVSVPGNAMQRLWAGLVGLGNRFGAQPAALGALPTLYAATAPDVAGGDYIGPGGFMQLRGHPVKVHPEAQARDRELAGELWRQSEEFTSVRYLS